MSNVLDISKAFENEERRNFQSFLVCLHYLCQEAKRENQPMIANILMNTITTIEEWADGQEPNMKYSIFDHSVYYALEFLSKFASLSKDKQQAMSQIFDKLRTEKLVN